MVDYARIYEASQKAVFSSPAQKEKFYGLKHWLSEHEYYELHRAPLTPTTMKIDINSFKKEIVDFENNFMPWGNKNLNLPRSGVPLVNQDGILGKENDPANGSLYDWNEQNPETPLYETDFLTPTPLMSLPSLQPLDALHGHWCRSSILKWRSGAEFRPHIDTVFPTPWLKLWGTTDSENLRLQFYSRNGERLDAGQIENGRIYLIDSSLVHAAQCTSGALYHFFLSALPTAARLMNGITDA